MIKHSIVIPTCGRPTAIKRAIKSLIDNDFYNFNAEVIVVDNNISNNFSEDILNFCNKLPYKITYLRELSPGQTAARHLGAKHAKGEIISFIDDDITISSSWFPTIQKAFENEDISLVGGPSIPNFTGSIPNWFWDFLSPTEYGGWMCPWLSLIDLGKDFLDVDPNYIWGLNFSIRKKILYKCDGFHIDLVPKNYEQWQGDGESGLTMKFNKLGYRADYLQGAMVYHECGPDRLSYEYFKKRAHYQGICDAYTKIRLNTKAKKNNLFKLLRKKFILIIKVIIGYESIWSKYSLEIKKHTLRSKKNAYDNHLLRVMGDKKLYLWVTKKNYFDVDIRDEYKND